MRIGGFERNTVSSAAVSGFATGVFSIPEGMAYAQLARLPTSTRTTVTVAASFFQSMPAGGSLSRTGISVGGGARSRWGGVFAAVWLAVLVLLFGNLAEAVPLAVIAGLLFVIAGELIVGRLPNAGLALHSSWGATAAMAATFVSALFIPLQWTIFLGAGLSLLVYLGTSFQAGTVTELVRTDDGYWSERPAPAVLTSRLVTVIGLRDWRFFADIPRLAGRLPRPDGAHDAAVVVRMRDTPQIHATGLRALADYRERLASAGTVLVLAGVEPSVMQTLARTGVGEKIGTAHIFPARPGLTEALDEAWDHARELVRAGPDDPASPLTRTE